jgi:hypothetical protein
MEIRRARSRKISKKNRKEKDSMIQYRNVKDAL